jgi:hypothetical protein
MLSDSSVTINRLFLSHCEGMKLFILGILRKLRVETGRKTPRKIGYDDRQILRYGESTTDKCLEPAVVVLLALASVTYQTRSPPI